MSDQEKDFKNNKAEMTIADDVMHSLQQLQITKARGGFPSSLDDYWATGNTPKGFPGPQQ